MWKLLADLLPGQLKLECKRASLSPSEEASHNLVKISKYIMANGYDPESFYFNTLYESDTANNLMGMIPTTSQALPSYTTSASSATSVRMSAGVAITSPVNPTLQPKFEDEHFILNQIKKMSSEIESLKQQMEEQRRPAQKKGSGLERDRQDELSSVSGLSSWYSFGSTSSESSVGSSFFSEKHRAKLESRLVSRRKYNKDLLIRPPQIALSARLSSRHIVLKFQNTLKMAGTFRKKPYKAVIWQAQNQFVEACTPYNNFISANSLKK